jgi:hypothetical protein
MYQDDYGSERVYNQYINIVKVKEGC